MANGDERLNKRSKKFTGGGYSLSQIKFQKRHMKTRHPQEGFK